MAYHDALGATPGGGSLSFGILGRLQKAQHLGREQLGSGIHRDMSLPGHDDDPTVGQRFPHRLAGSFEGIGAVAAQEEKRRHVERFEAI